MENPLKVYAAVAKIQAELKPLSPEGENPHFHSEYVTLAQVWSAVSPLFQKHGLICIQTLWQNEGVPVLVTQLIETQSGEKVTSHIPLLVPNNSMQGLGSAITYARRYSLCALLGITERDDDANETTAQSQQTTISRTTNKITEPQGKRLYAIAVKHGYTLPIIEGMIEKHFGYKKIQEILIKDYNACVDLFQKSA